MKFKSALLMLLVALPLGLHAQQTPLDTLSLKTIFYEPYLAGTRPDFDAFAPGGKSIFFTWNDSARSENEHFQVDFRKQKVDPVTDAFESNFTPSPDGKYVLFNKDGDLWLADADFSNKRALVTSDQPEYNATWSPDGKKVAYVQKGDVWITGIDTPMLKQVTSKKEDEPGYNIDGWATDHRLVLHQYDTSGYKEYYFPEYTGKYVEAGATKRGVARQIISVAYLDSNKVKLMFDGKDYADTDISADGRYLAIDRIDAPMKHRVITVVDMLEPKSTQVFEDSTKGWLYGTDLAFAPSGNLLMFRSEQSGWNHIYTVNPDGSGLKQHTSGDFEVPWAAWLDAHRIVYASTEVDPGERHVYTIDLRNDRTEKLTEATGYREAFHLGPNKRWLVYKKTYFNEPFELYALDLKRPRKEIRLTHSIPGRFKAINWQKPEYKRFTGRDGETQISMTMLPVLHPESGKKYPLVVFVHGAGSLQNVYKGWSDYYYREYMFNQFLTAHGYNVMQVDYRHSTGYGRKFREDVTNWMGKYETRDIEDGIDQIAGRSYVDTSRVGIYGGSYGGFMSLYAVSVAPDYFDAAAALRAVTNWRNYYYTNPWYTLPRLGTPEADSANYARSSPLTYADSLKRPVLILHGLRDNNVGFQDAAQYIEKLIQSGNKHFQMMMYPSERHSFQDPDSWYDEYRRIYHFFNEKLKQE